MDYSTTIKYLYEQLPMYQRSGAVAYKNNLDNSLALDELFEHPHRNFKTIHIAGTNGKGSVSHMLASVLQSGGYKVGLYTSPHLKDYRERIRINGEMISETAVSEFVERFLNFNIEKKLEPSFFELSVTMAFDYFAKEQVDVAVIEVGMGGRLDSTNVITPEISIITNISLDHTQFLGNTIGKIAVEKAGIIKPNVPVVIGETHEESELVFMAKANELIAPIVFADGTFSIEQDDDETYSILKESQLLYDKIDMELKGFYQQNNLKTCVTAIDILQKKGFNITIEAIRNGLKKVTSQTGLAGRWQQLGVQPKIICDTGHNEAGIAWIVQQLGRESYRKLHVVFGTVNDKDVSGILKLLPKNATYYFTQAAIERAMDANKLKQEAVNFQLNGDVYRTVSEALNAAKSKAEPDDFIFVGGSTFVVAEVL